MKISLIRQGCYLRFDYMLHRNSLTIYDASLVRRHVFDKTREKSGKNPHDKERDLLRSVFSFCPNLSATELIMKNLTDEFIA